MKKTFLPCSRPICIRDQESGEIPPYYDYIVNQGGRYSIGVVIDDVEGTELVYVDGHKDPVASMLPGQRESDEMLEALYKGWTPESAPTVTVRVGTKGDHFYAWVGTSLVCRSKRLGYVQRKIKERCEFYNVVVEYHLNDE